MKYSFFVAGLLLVVKTWILTFPVEAQSNLFSFDADISAGIKIMSDGDSDWGDFDQDGDLDLLVTGLYQGNISVALFRNQGGQFEEVETALPGVFLGSCDWGDYDRDGDLDILLMGGTQYNFEDRHPAIYVYTNQNGSFTLLESSVSQLPKAYHGESRWADFNNDGLLDIVINGLGFSGIFQGDGAGNFSIRYKLPYVFQFGNVHCGDYDGDGDLDIAVSGVGINPIKVFRNDGNWNFSQVKGDFVGGVGGSLNWADMDNDGDLDLVVSGQLNSGGGGIPLITVYENQDTLFKAKDNSEMLYHTDDEGCTATGDFNNDGITDLIASTQGGSVYSPALTLFKNDGEGDLITVNTELPDVVSRTASWIDYDLDHDLDIFVSSHLIRNNTDQKNTPPLSPSSVKFDSVYNNAIYFHWDEGTDLETASTGLSYQIYMGTESLKQDIVNSNAHLTSGFRTIADLGNLKGKHARVENLADGFYFFGVQSIDASYEGSRFSEEANAFVIKVEGSSGACPEFDYSYVAKPAGYYEWEVTGGTIISGQGSDSLVVNWNSLGKGYVKILNSQGARNTFEVHVEEIPSPSISGDVTICTGLQSYSVTDDFTHFTDWIIPEPNSIQEQLSNEVVINFTQPGLHNLIAKSFSAHKGCFSYDTIKINIDQKPAPPLIIGQPYACVDQVAEYSTSSINPTWTIVNGSILQDNEQKIKIQWPSNIGNATIFIEIPSTNAFCSTYDSLLLEVYSVPAKPTLTLFQDSIILSSPSPTNYYKWYDRNRLIGSGPYNGLIPYASGSYSVEVFNSYGCGSKSNPFQFGSLVTSIQEPEGELSEKQVEIYPNPAHNKINFNLTNGFIGQCEVEIFSITSGIVKRFYYSDNDYLLKREIDISNLQAGTYIFRLQTRDKKYLTKFFKK